MVSKSSPLKGFSDRPWISNYPTLETWLKSHGARSMWQVGMQCQHDLRNDASPTAYVECWFFPSSQRLAVITVHAKCMGWELYTPGDSLLITETLADAEVRLGLEATMLTAPHSVTLNHPAQPEVRRVRLCDAALLCANEATLAAVYKHGEKTGRPVACCEEHKKLCEERAEHHRVSVSFVPISSLPTTSKVA